MKYFPPKILPPTFFITYYGDCSPTLHEWSTESPLYQALRLLMFFFLYLLYLCHHGRFHGVTDRSNHDVTGTDESIWTNP